MKIVDDKTVELHGRTRENGVIELAEGDGENVARQIIALAGLSVQHTCIQCKKLLLAFGREPDDPWSCPNCNVPNTTVAALDDEAKKS